jgi:hypothetical protein
MFTENGVLIDLDELRGVVDDCDVFTVGFRLFPERLIVDTRSAGDVGPMIEVVEPVSTVEERFFWLGKRRPEFSAPQRFTFFIWPHSIPYFEESGVGDMIRHRVYPAAAEAGSQMAKSMIRLHTLERGAVADAITGRNCHTIWPQDEV